MNDYTIGWILLTCFLTIGLLIFLILWILCLNNLQNQPLSNVCFGEFGVITGTDANQLNLCGTSQSDPCIFAINTIADAEKQCDTLKFICNAFTFSSNNSTMKIVQNTNTFPSISTNLFIRQSNVAI